MSDKRPNAEFIRQSHEYIIQASPTAAHQRLHSQRSSGLSSSNSGGLMSPREANDSALASQVAYGRASARKLTEFEMINAGGALTALNTNNEQAAQQIKLLER